MPLAGKAGRLVVGDGGGEGAVEGELPGRSCGACLLQEASIVDGHSNGRGGGGVYGDGAADRLVKQFAAFGIVEEGPVGEVEGPTDGG